MLLETERLVLIPCPAEFVDALPDRKAAGKAIGATVPEGFPDQELAGFLPVFRQWLRDDRSAQGFGPWLLVARDERVVVGSAGFLGRPGDDGTIEMGFGVLPDNRNRGFASEAAMALLGWAFRQPGVRRVSAKCEERNLASVRVLEKIGMRRQPGRGPQLEWLFEGS